MFKDLPPVFHKLLQIIEKETILNLFYEANITLIPKPDRYHEKKREVQTNISYISSTKYQQTKSRNIQQDYIL